MGRIARPPDARRVIGPTWHFGPLEALARGTGRPVAWHVRLDDPVIARTADRAALRADDLRDLAGRPDAAMRGLRRRLAKVLLAHLAGEHPDRVAIARTGTGALRVDSPPGWWLSVAGQWPHALIGVAPTPLGSDIEPADAEPPPPDVFTPRETAELRGASPQQLVCRWAAKEAHAKLFGNASIAEPRSIETEADGAGRMRVSSAEGRSVCDLTIRNGAIQAIATR